jgi:predicted ATPase/class 3 adenylate cyclase
VGNGGAVTRTFLFTDLEGSTRQWEDEPDVMRAALARHDELLRTVIEANDGTVFSTAGDGFAAAFPTAETAVRVAVDGQLALSGEAWPGKQPLKARMGLHTDAAHERDGNFFGPGLNRCARLMGAAHGGQIVCSEATAVLVRDSVGATTRFVDLGEHRLRDLSRPLRVYQVNHPELPSEFPALRSLDAFPSNLPAQVATFIGREADLVTVAEAVQASRLVTLTGVGGVGKTRLALQAAADVLPAYADGAWLVELGGVADALAVEEAIAAALGVQEQPGQTLRESVLAFLRGKRLLMILDNCEHLLEPIADFVETALSRAPKLAVLATSREALGLRGERVLGVRSLPVPPTDTDLATLVTAEAIALFVDRAQAARDGFALTIDNGAAVAHLCRRLDGIPLAIELAAARIRAMAPAEIAARLDQRFRLLTGSGRRTANRHQTLRRAIDWSWDLLGEDERTLLRRLSVCVGGFDLAAAEAIGSGGVIDAYDVDDLLGHLVEKSLVVAEERGDTTRYRMLETIREYVLERLEDAREVDESRERHARHYAAFAEEAGVGLRSARERGWLERTDDELDNLRLAVAWATDAGQPALALRIIAALSLHGLRIETSVGAWAETAITAPGAPGDPRYPAGLACVAWAVMRQGDSKRALALGREALELSCATTDDDARVRMQVIATTSGVLGTMQQPESAEVIDEWVALATRLEDPYDTALAHAMLCVNRFFRGLPDALEAGERAVAAARRCGSPTALAYSLLTLALTLDQTDHVDRALAVLDEAVACADSVDNRYGAFVAGQTRGQIHSRIGNYDLGLQLTFDGVIRAWRAGHRAQQALGLWWCGGVLAITGHDEPAAVIAGWVQSVFGGIQAGTVSAQFLSVALESLPARLGEPRYSGHIARGAAMDDDEIIHFAQAAIEAVLGDLVARA